MINLNPSATSGASRRVPPAMLAGLSLASGVVGPALFVGAGAMTIFVGMDGSGSLLQRVPWAFQAALLGAIVGGLLAVVALVSGIMALRRLSGEAGGLSRIGALIGVVLGGLFTAQTALAVLGLLATIAGSLAQTLLGWSSY